MGDAIKMTLLTCLPLSPSASLKVGQLPLVLSSSLFVQHIDPKPSGCNAYHRLPQQRKALWVQSGCEEQHLIPVSVHLGGIFDL